MSNSIQLFQKFGLVNSQVSYSEIANAFHTTGYTSFAGNTYFNSIRFGEGILIKEDIGIGYIHTFLNGIKIFSIKDKTLIADASFNSLIYSKSIVRDKAKDLLLITLKQAAKLNQSTLNEKEAIRVIERVLNQAMNEDQRELLLKQTQKYLK